MIQVGAVSGTECRRVLWQVSRLQRDKAGLRTENNRLAGALAAEQDRCQDLEAQVQQMVRNQPCDISAAATQAKYKVSYALPRVGLLITTS